MSGPRYPAVLPENLSLAQKVFYNEMGEKIKGGLGSTSVLVLHVLYLQILMGELGLPCEERMASY